MIREWSEQVANMTISFKDILTIIPAFAGIQGASHRLLTSYQVRGRLRRCGL